jgi:AraC family transcriptional regulator, exoenzyme S synthesis regulatory protein ExsA
MPAILNLFQGLKAFPAINKQLTCDELLFTHYDCPQPEGRQSFLIEQNLIIYVISGRRIFHKGTRSWEMSKGVCAFIKKGTHISERLFSDSWCVMAFFMPDHFLRQLVTENKGKLKMARPVKANFDHVSLLDVSPLSESIFDSMHVYFMQDPAPPEILLELKFRELVLSLLINSGNEQLLAYLYHLSHAPRPSIEEIMQENYSFHLTLADYAKLACVSVPTFKREFRKVFKDAPARWVLRKKLDHAATLLANSDLPITEITMECGFENQTHFSRVFRKKYGEAPSQWRRSKQKVKEFHAESQS